MALNKRLRGVAIAAAFLWLGIGGYYLWQRWLPPKAPQVTLLHAPDPEMLRAANELVRIEVTPDFPYSVTLMQAGALQHLDRNYTYDVVPPELTGGILFQGIHRPPKKTSVTFELLEPATVYLFFHSEFDGGYDELLRDSPDWYRCDSYPQYDLAGGDHGRSMIMYAVDAKPGSYRIPPTSKERACFNLVFQPHSQARRDSLRAAMRDEAAKQR